MSGERGYLLPNRRWFPLDGRLHKVWWLYGDRAPWFMPMWLWRPLCWLDRGHDDDSYGSCVRCRKPLAAPPPEAPQ